MIYDWIRKYRIALIIVAAALLLGIISYNVFILSTRAGKTKVEVVVVPKDATIQVNGEGMRPPLYLAPGEYTFSASKTGFTTLQQTKVISEKDITLTMPLAAESDEAKKWADQNQQQYAELEGIAGKIANQEGEALSDQHPIIQALPYSNFFYTIGYRNDLSDPSGNSIIITIDAITGYRNAAIKQIRELGYDPAQYKIEFKNYESPFENE
jgi:hypothetical protein